MPSFLGGFFLANKPLIVSEDMFKKNSHARGDRFQLFRQL